MMYSCTFTCNSSVREERLAAKKVDGWGFNNYQYGCERDNVVQMWCKVYVLIFIQKSNKNLLKKVNKSNSCTTCISSFFSRISDPIKIFV